MKIRIQKKNANSKTKTKTKTAKRRKEKNEFPFQWAHRGVLYSRFRDQVDSKHTTVSSKETFSRLSRVQSAQYFLHKRIAESRNRVSLQTKPTLSPSFRLGCAVLLSCLVCFQPLFNIEIFFYPRPPPCRRCVWQEVGELSSGLV